MKHDSIVHERNVPLGMAHKIRALSNRSKRVSSARTEAELKPIRGATASKDEYIVDGDPVKVNRALDKQVVHSVYRCGLSTSERDRVVSRA